MPSDALSRRSLADGAFQLTEPLRNLSHNKLLQLDEHRQRPDHRRRSIIALDVESALTAAGFHVCGVASSETEAIDLAEHYRPDLAVVDISLSPGDGRVVAKALCGMGTGGLFATGQCDEVEGLHGTGAVACLPKPYDANLVPEALHAVERLQQGSPEVLPDHMFALAA